MKRIGILFFCWIILFSSAYGQTENATFSYKEYLINILKYHPVAKQANLKLDIAKAEWLNAKGNFDPTLSSSWNQKNFDDKLYYRQFQGQLQIPTRLGVDIVGGYENTSGTFLNPENNTDQYGLWNVGLEANLLQGLLVNERNTALKQAKVFQKMANNQQQVILNELLYTASFAYLEWQKYMAFQKVIQENIQIANTYFENTKISFENGEKTAMDTLEALIILQDANTLFQANESALSKSRQRLENFLWVDENPVELKTNIFPQEYSDTLFFIQNSNSIASLVDSNPMLLEKLNKQSILEIEQKLKREKLKPKLKAKYNPLLATSENSISPNFSTSDYKWGFEFAMPLFLRSERANIQKGEIKMKENFLDIQNKRNELLNKIENSLEQQSILQEQVALQEQNVEGYQQLLEGENEKFRYGESSVFLLNKRQEKYINGQMKLISTFIKQQMEVLNYLYYSNDLLVE